VNQVEVRQTDRIFIALLGYERGKAIFIFVASRLGRVITFGLYIDFSDFAFFVHAL